MAQRVVFITGGVFDREVREFLDEGNHRVLEKPLSLEKLVDVLDDVAKSAAVVEFGIDEAIGVGDD